MINLTTKNLLTYITLLFASYISAQTTVTFNSTGGIQNWTVPPCVTSISVTAAGAEGGGLLGGNGAIITATILVTPGQVIGMTVGGPGGSPGGGYNGGGAGYVSTDGTLSYNSSSGGGATKITIGGVTYLIAAGGGGEGGGSGIVGGGAGGCATGLTGTSTFGGGATGGSQTAGGLGGAPWAGTPPGGQNGSLGQGGNGGLWQTASGGGGGGGYYGGGGGGNDGCCTGANGGGGGGGGSSLVPAGAGCNAGTNNGSGYVSITYTSGASIVPTFTALGPYCRCATPNTLPTTSLNGITGTWSPSTISTATAGTTIYTFTPSAGQCAVPTTMSITVNALTVTMPANGSSTVACPSATNTAPTPPTVLDNCGRTLTVSAPVISAIPTCSGTRTYTYTYTNACAGTYPWVYTYTVSTPTVVMPANGSSTVACPSATNTAPTTPTVLDNCGRTLTVSAPVISAIPTCAGTRTYTYTYTSCSGTTYPWVYTYTVSNPTVVMPANGSSTVACPSATTAPTTPTVLDNCGRTLTVSAPVISAIPTCAGTRTYTYTYTSCSGTTYPWVYTYTVSNPTVVMPANGSSTVACPSATNTAPTTPTVLDNCGRTLTVSAPVISAIPACAGTRTYTYTYTSCSGTTYPWVYTYTVSNPTVVMPANGSSTVACPSATNTAPTTPTVLDNCGRTLTVSVPVISAIPTCSGTRTYTYTYTSCSGTTYPWVYTYSVSAPTVVMPANGGSTVACPSATNTAPTAPTVLDNCGRTLTVSAPIISAIPACAGSRTYTYTYTSCSGTTYPWVYTYSISTPTVVMPANGTATVSCPTLVTAPTVPTILDNCGRTLTVTGPVISALPACSGTQTYTYTFTSCSGTTYPWVYTYTINDNILPTASNPASISIAGGVAPAPDPLLVTDEADNCSTPTVVWFSDATDGGNCPEIITRTYSVTDACGNQILVTQTITIGDAILPTASNPASISVQCIADVPVQNPIVVIDEADNGGTPVVTWESNVSNGGSCPEVITRTYRVTDDCGNFIFVTQTITVEDITAPVFAAAPAAVTVSCAADVPAMTNLGYTDNCDAAGSVAGTDVSNGGTCPEIITRTWTYTDACGNPATTSQTITVHDLVAPVFAAAPANVTVSCAADVPAMTNLGYTDNCDAAGSVAGTDVSNGGTCPEIITRTWTFTDACGNPATTSQTITVHDLVAPVFASAPAAVTVSCIADVPAMTNLWYTDNCDAAGSVAGTDGALVGGACGGTITRTWTFTDACGNTSTTTQTITVDDNVLPTASNPVTTTVPGGPAPAVDVTVVTDEADNCSVPVVAFVSESTDGAACPETITRIYSVTDACGNTINVTHIILITDPFPPTASNPLGVTVECIGDVPTPDITVVMDEADNNGTPTVVFVSDVSNGATCPEIITRTYSVTDACNNSITVTQLITVNDITAPTATAPISINIECFGDIPAANIALITDEADNCTSAPIVAHVGDVSNGLSCPETITRTYSITDDCGNITNVTQSIIINDITAPTATAPSAVNVECIGDVPAANIALITNEADNCTAVPIVAHVGDVSDGLTCPETITRTYSITDDCGNVTTVTQSIIVNDTTDPTASNPPTVAVELPSQVPVPNPSVVTNEADNCTLAPVVAWVNDVSDGNTCPETITRTYSVTDDCNNSITVVQTITISDLTVPTASNPASVNVECIGDVPAFDITAVTDEADNSGIIPTVTFVSDVSDGNTCPETITRTYLVTDDCNNSITVAQTIVVNDVTVPTATAPADVYIECIGDVPAANTALITDEADNCTVTPVVTHVGDVSNGLSCPETITRTYSITDDCGNITNVTQLIIINDVTAPTGTAPPMLNVQCIGDVPSAPLSGIPSGMTGVSDNCSANPTVNFVSDVSDGNTCPETITRTYSITDDCGNQTLVTQQIVVNDITAPTASDPAPISVVSVATVPAPDPTVVIDEEDNCTVNPIVTWVSDVSDGNVCNYEKITRTYSVTDDCGNQITVTQLITITAIYPTLNAGVDQSICENETATLIGTFSPATTVISWPAPILNNAPFTPLLGTTSYTLTGNNYNCISTDVVSVVVNPLPIAGLISDEIMGCEPLDVILTNTSIYTTAVSSCVWNLGDGTIVNGCGPISHTYEDAGLYDVTLTTTDANGCSNTFLASNYIYVEPYPIANFSASEYTLNNLTISTEVDFTNLSSGASTYVWNFGDDVSSIDENPSHAFETLDAGSYEVTLIAYSEMGCADTIQQYITITEELIFYVPNTFTPDGNHVNNTFQPVFTSGFDPYNFTLLIFNRWGELIFESHNAEIGWDGTYNGKLMQQGTYTWKLDFKSRVNDEKYVQMGHVNLMR